MCDDIQLKEAPREECWLICVSSHKMHWLNQSNWRILKYPVESMLHAPNVSSFLFPKYILNKRKKKYFHKNYRLLMVLSLQYTPIGFSLQRGLPISLVLLEKILTQIILYLSLIWSSRASVFFLILIIALGQFQMIHLIWFIRSPIKLKKFWTHAILIHSNINKFYR